MYTTSEIDISHVCSPVLSTKFTQKLCMLGAAPANDSNEMVYAFKQHQHMIGFWLVWPCRCGLTDTTDTVPRRQNAYQSLNLVATVQRVVKDWDACLYVCV